MKEFNNPEHYHKGDIDVITFIQLYFGNDKSFTVDEAFFIVNIVKYVCRYKYKNGLDDLVKAKDYTERLMKLYEK